MDELRYLDRQTAVGRSHLGALELPRHEAAMVQMVPTDLRIRVESLQRISERLALGRWADSKFELELHLAARDRIATYRARRACAWAAERAVRFGRWESAALDRFAGFLSEDCLAGHEQSSSNGSARPRTARGAHHEGTPMEGQPGNYLISDAGSTSVSRTALLEQRIRSARIRQLPNDFHLFAVEPRAFVAGAPPVVGMCRVDVYKSRRRRGVLLRRLCLVGPSAPLGVPDLKALQVKPRQVPVLSTQQAHWVIGRDSRAAAIAHVPEARTAPPQLDRACSWKQTAFNPISYALSHESGTMTAPITHLRDPLNAPLVQGTQFCNPH
jgi:hypothetical protein